MKYYDNPYQTEYWNALKKRQNDNQVHLGMVKVLSFFFALGIVYLLFKR